MRLGVLILPEHRWEAAEPLWRRAEELGFDHAWTYDHIAWGPLRDEPWFAAVPTLAAAAGTTKRIRLGTLVATPNFRHPVPFARELITLDDLTGGRLTAGLGAGSVEWDAIVLGGEPLPPRLRSARFAEFVSLLDRLLRQPATTYAGAFYSAVAAPTAPGCVQQPRIPLAIAATGPRGMKVVAEHADIWVTNGDRSHQGPPLAAEAGAAVVRRQAAVLEEACLAAGRDVASLDRLVLTGTRLDPGLGSRAAFDEVVGAYEAAGVTDLVVHWPRDSGPYAGDLAALERIVGR